MEASRPTRSSAQGLTTPWLAARLGVQPTEVEVRRRAGELIGVPVPGSPHHVYPAWQFGPGLEPLPVVPQLTRTARDRGLDDRRLCELMEVRLGPTGTKRLADLLV